MAAHSVSKEVDRFVRESRAFIREIKANPEKAKDFLVEAGIAVRDPSRPSGIRLAERFR